MWLPAPSAVAETWFPSRARAVGRRETFGLALRLPPALLASLVVVVGAAPVVPLPAPSPHQGHLPNWRSNVRFNSREAAHKPTLYFLGCCSRLCRRAPPRARLRPQAALVLPPVPTAAYEWLLGMPRGTPAHPTDSRPPTSGSTVSTVVPEVSSEAEVNKWSHEWREGGCGTAGREGAGG